MKLSDQIALADRPFVIAGPCSAESDKQMDEVAGALATIQGISILRAGIWKPRTSPDSFEGIGQSALKWLVDAAKRHGLKSATEVANARHVEAALNAGIDVIWIGARTTVNPFAVQEIVDSLVGVEIPVLIKNPVNPDLKLWLGAFERFERGGIMDLVAVHRGFSVYNHSKYRNVPNWEIPIALKELRPDLTLLCDPSHISGRRSGLKEVSQKAMDLNFDGLMIETHPTPELALSDADQQLKPSELRQLIASLILRTPLLNDEIAAKLEEKRDQLAVIDDQLFELLARRMAISEEVGDLKRRNNITILQQQHWLKIIASRLEKMDDYRLSEDFIRQFMDAVHQESIRHQTKVMNPNQANNDKEGAGN